jgi:hypothetical protein
VLYVSHIVKLPPSLYSPWIFSSPLLWRKWLVCVGSARGQSGSTISLFNTDRLDNEPYLIKDYVKPGSGRPWVVLVPPNWLCVFVGIFAKSAWRIFVDIYRLEDEPARPAQKVARDTFAASGFPEAR